MTEQEKRLKAKLPGTDTGIEIRHTMCDICSPGMHCGINAYIKDEKVIKIEGLDGHPSNDGRLCTKGMANREFIYREDRILTPLKRIGERGEGKFEPITWEQAYEEIAANLKRIKEEYGAESTAFYSGYTKWYRQTLRRFAYAYGTPNYGCESSACYTSAFMAWKALAGDQADADMGNSDLYLGWACNPFYSCYMYGRACMKRKEAGMKFIIVDTRRTPAVEKLADLFIQPKAGTDGALAHAIANVLIERNWIDLPYIQKYVYGFEEYADYVKEFNETNIEKITGVPYALVVKAAEMIHESRHMSANESSAPISHHRNGFQNYRAIMSLLSITGNFDVVGGHQLTPHSFMHVSCGIKTREEQYLYENKPKNTRPCIGAGRFPLWDHMEGEMQSMDLPRQILEGTPYPIKAVYGVGLNARMFPDSDRMFHALKSLDFFVDTDLFLTDTAMYADIVLPACSSFERGEFKLYASGTAWYTTPAIKPLGESKSDVQILTELANYMQLPDPVLLAGYDYFIQHYILDDFGITIDELKKVELPIPIGQQKPFVPYAALDAGLSTPTGKFELKSALIESHPEWGLDALPTYIDPLDTADASLYPHTFVSGPRIPNAIHSRLHKVPRNRSLRPDPTADIHPLTGRAISVKDDEWITISTPRGSISVKCHLTESVQEDTVTLFHGYSEADSAKILDGDHLDPYAGFPAYRSTRCRITKKED